MVSKKLYAYLSLFSKKEMGQFEKFLNSPYFNDNPEMATFLRLIAPDFLQDNKPAITKEKLWKGLYGQMAYRDQKMRKLTSSLYHLAVEFKAVESLLCNTPEVLIKKLHTVNHPKLKTHIDFFQRKFNDFADSTERNTADFQYYRMQYEELNHRYFELAKDNKKLATLDNLHQANHHLNLFYFAKKLAYLTDALGYRMVLSVSKNFVDDDNVFEQIPESIAEEPIIKINKLIYQMLMHLDNEQYYYALKDYIFTNQHLFPVSHLNRYFTHLLNYCLLHKINKGEESFFAEAFAVFKKMIDGQLILVNGYIDFSYYRNIVAIGIQLEQYEWTEAFIQDFSTYLPVEHKENAITYNLARVYYSQKKYKKVLELLRNLEVSNLTYALSTKVLLIGTYYALNEYRALEALLLSFKVYILRNKLLTKATKQEYLNFIRFTQKLVYLAPHETAKKEKLRHQVESSPNIMARSWLLARLDEI